MRDISGPRATSHVPLEHSALPQPTPPTFLERLFGRVNQLGGQIVSDNPVIVKQPVLSSTLPQTKVKRAKTRKMPKGVATKAGRAIKHVATRSGEELKKPGRKTALLQTVALGALFAVVVSSSPWKQSSTTVTTATEAATRRYLPSIANTPTNEPLDATAALAKTGKQVNLYGWITPWNVASGTSDSYNAASAFWLTVADDGIAVHQKADWKGWETYKQTHVLTETYLTVSGNPNNTYKALANPDTQSLHIAALLDAVSTHGFDGIDIDYEGLGSANRDIFTTFIRNLTTVFHKANKKVAVTLEARIANQVPMDWHTIGQLSDEVRIMAYDYHSHNTATPGPISPLSWVAEIAAYATEQIDSQKIVMGLGNYGYDWTAPDSTVQADGTTQTSWEGVGISYDQATALSKTNNAPVVHKTGIDERGYDIGTIPSFSYTDADQHLHQVWFEDATSLQEKVNILATYKVKGVMFWSVGAGDPALWQPQA